MPKIDQRKHTDEHVIVDGRCYRIPREVNDNIKYTPEDEQGLELMERVDRVRANEPITEAPAKLREVIEKQTETISALVDTVMKQGTEIEEIRAQLAGSQVKVEATSDNELPADSVSPLKPVLEGKKTEWKGIKVVEAKTTAVAKARPAATPVSQKALKEAKAEVKSVHEKVDGGG